MTIEKKHCFTPVNQGNEDYRVAKVIENESGYYPLGKADPNDPHELDKLLAIITTLNLFVINGTNI